MCIICESELVNLDKTFKIHESSPLKNIKVIVELFDTLKWTMYE